MLLEAYDEALGPLGLTYGYGIVLLNCGRREANTAAELAFLNGLDISSVSRMLDHLEKKGLVKRSRSRRDRRKSMVQLTTKGQEVVRKMISVATRVTVDARREITKEESAIVRKAAYKILRNLGHIQILRQSGFLQGRSRRHRRRNGFTENGD